MLKTLGVPTDPRGIVLACGFVGAAAVGVGALLPPGDPIGFAYIAAAVIGYVFVQTKFLPTLLWLLIAAYGLLGGLGGAPGGWVEAALGALLATTALLPVQWRPSGGVPAMAPAAMAPFQPNGQSSSPAEVAQLDLSETSAKAEESSAAPIAADAIVNGSAPGILVVRAFGPLTVRLGSVDLTSQLRDKFVLHFMFSYLLAQWVLEEPHVARASFADELSPKMPTKNQLERLRRQLYDLQHDVSPELGAFVRTDRSHVWLALEETDSDAGQLREAAKRAVVDHFTLRPEQIAGARSILDQTNGEFLAGFEELEKRVTGHGGTAGDVVTRARLHVAGQRADLARALSESEDALGRPDTALPYLRSVLDQMQDRQDIARLLAIGYLKTGQLEHAQEVRRQFAIKELS